MVKLWGSGVTSDLEFETTLGTTKWNIALGGKKKKKQQDASESGLGMWFGQYSQPC